MDKYVFVSHRKIHGWKSKVWILRVNLCFNLGVACLLFFKFFKKENKCYKFGLKKMH
jgi:hypothetical protein